MGRRSVRGVVVATVVISGVAPLTLSPSTAEARVPSRTSIPASGSASATSGSTTRLTASAASAVARMRSSSRRALKVQSSRRGAVSFVSSRDGRALLRARAGETPRAAVERQLARYGGAFGLDGSRSRAVVTQSTTSATGGEVVRAQQVVDGVPVFGGQLVSTLDRSEGLVSVAAATTPSVEVPAPRIAVSVARRTALLTTSRAYRIRIGYLRVTDLGRRLYDPALVTSPDASGVRPVWAFRVADSGGGLRETVLVETSSGRVALKYNDAPGSGLDRTVCDDRNAARTSSGQPVPGCSDARAARREGGPASGVSDVNRAYLNLGVVASAYQRLAGIDLTSVVGARGSDGRKTLMSTVRWCFKSERCPMGNAFWDGRQMVFGQGFAGADDVVGHELTHGYIQRSSALFPFSQSGAISESLADTIGELADQLKPGATANDSAWVVGEDLRIVAARRSMKDPPLYGQPDKMTSSLYGGNDAFVDQGDVHLNDGVGNKTAYLISQGGTFNGRTITGLDAGSAAPMKTGLLYLETIPRLVSGAEYSDLGTTLASTCDLLAAAATGGFTGSDCDQVREAVLATELAKLPRSRSAIAAEAPNQCPSGYSDPVRVAAEDDGTRTLDSTLGALWSRTPEPSVTALGPTPRWSASGPSSWFAWDPDPSAGTGRGSSSVLGPFTVPSTGGSLLWFRQAYLLEGYPAQGRSPAQWYDGATVTVQTLSGGTWTTRGSLPWVNGPDKVLEGTRTRAWSGDSHGYGSSAVDLTSLAGQTTRVLFGVRGDESNAFLGWWVDDIRLNNCQGDVPDAPTGLAATVSGRSVQLSWTPPADTTGVAGYRIRRSDDANDLAVPASSTGATLRGFTGTGNVSISVEAVAADGSPGPSARAPALAAGTPSIAVSSHRVYAGQRLRISVKAVRRGYGTPVAGAAVELQRHVAGTSTWTTVSRGTTSAAGYRAWTTTQSRLTAYRVVVSPQPRVFGSISPSAYVSMR